MNKSSPDQPAIAPEDSPHHTLRVGGMMPSLSNRAHLSPLIHTARGTKRRIRFTYLKRWWQLIVKNHLHTYALLVAVVVAVLQIIVFSANLFRSTQPILGLRFDGRDITNFSRARIADQVQQAILKVEQEPPIVQAGTSRTKLNPRQLGARYSTTSLIAAIYATGRSGSLWQQLLAQDQALFGWLSFHLGFPDINVALTKDYLAKVNDAIEQPPTNAGLLFMNDKVRVTTGQSGHSLDIDRSIQALRDYDTSLDAQLLILPLKQLPPPLGKKAVESLLPEVRRITDKPLVVKAGSRRAVVSRMALTNMLAIESVADPRRPTKNKPTIVIDQTDADKVSAQLVSQFDRDALPRILNSDGSVMAAGQDGDVLDGIRTKVALISHMLLRQQLAVDSNKPLELASTHVKAPVLPKNADPQRYSGDLSAYGANNAPRMTLTFEGMPNATYGPRILDVLKRYGVHAIFFAVGRNTLSYPDVMRQMVADGHTIGISTYSYRDVSKLTDKQVSDDIGQSQAAVAKVIGGQPTLFRSPYGGSTPAADSVLQQAHLTQLNWTLDALDWANLPANFIANRVVSGARPGGIVLMHSLNGRTAEALPQIIDGLKKKGYVLN